MTWFVVAMLALGTAGQRLIGMFGVGSLLDRRPTLASLADLLPAAVVTALVAQLTFATAGQLTLDARAAGLTVAGLLVWRRSPFIVVVFGAAAVTATLRALA